MGERERVEKREREKTALPAYLPLPPSVYRPSAVQAAQDPYSSLRTLAHAHDPLHLPSLLTLSNSVLRLKLRQMKEGARGAWTSWGWGIAVGGVALVVGHGFLFAPASSTPRPCQLFDPPSVPQRPAARFLHLGRPHAHASPYAQRGGLSASRCAVLLRVRWGRVPCLQPRVSLALRRTAFEQVRSPAVSRSSPLAPAHVAVRASPLPYPGASSSSARLRFATRVYVPQPHHLVSSSPSSPSPQLLRVSIAGLVPRLVSSRYDPLPHHAVSPVPCPRLQAAPPLRVLRRPRPFRRPRTRLGWYSRSPGTPVSGQRRSRRLENGQWRIATHLGSRGARIPTYFRLWRARPHPCRSLALTSGLLDLFGPHAAPLCPAHGSLAPIMCLLQRRPSSALLPPSSARPHFRSPHRRPLGREIRGTSDGPLRRRRRALCSARATTARCR
ncbi:hypothetical protein FB451DRAFT_1527237 [Mycena latifolia]|nr:hypothetical protein FB451DRAFT_1527237 [Mycena latifolia]